MFAEQTPAQTTESDLVDGPVRDPGLGEAVSATHAPRWLPPGLAARLRRRPPPDFSPADSVLPGRWVGGIACVLGPLAVLAAVLLRAPFHFFFPQQLAAFAEHRGLMSVSSSLFTVGMLLLVPAVVLLASSIATTHPRLARWGALCAVAGLCVRHFHAGVDHLAFRLVDVQGLAAANQAVADSYAADYVLAVPMPLIMVGWVLLAVGAFRSGTFGLMRSVALGSMAALMIGVLKGTNLVSILVVTGLCVALVPFGIMVLRTGSRPTPRTIAGYSGLTILALLVLWFLGTAG